MSLGTDRLGMQRRTGVISRLYQEFVNINVRRGIGIMEVLVPKQLLEVTRVLLELQAKLNVQQDIIVLPEVPVRLKHNVQQIAGVLSEVEVRRLVEEEW